MQVPVMDSITGAWIALAIFAALIMILRRTGKPVQAPQFRNLDLSVAKQRLRACQVEAYAAEHYDAACELYDLNEPIRSQLKVES
jgi:hypothetical protein